nr:hypothetical protein [Tanacetum cinerariifolium]
MDRSTWMYQIERAMIEYLEHLSIFLKVAEDDLVKKEKSKIHCPCKKCLNWTCYLDLKTIKSHLIEKGFMQRHTCWDFHGEVKPKSNTSVLNCDVEYNNDPNNNNHDNLNDMSPNLEGPKQPGNDIGIYLKPLIKDMQDLWSKGVEVYDAYKKETFQMRAMIFCTISDFLAYGNLSGYKTKGKMACTGKKALQLQKRVFGKKKSIFWDLPYWERLQVRHCLNVMHIEKNVCESLIGLLLNIQGKTKDAVKVRKDMEAMKIRPELAPREIMIPIAIRGILPDRIRHTITKLCLFFNKIHSKVIDPELLDQWQRDNILTIYELEMYFPPSFFDVMVHLVDVDKKMAQGLILKEKGAAPLIVVLGPEHGGRTRTVGDGICFKKGIKGYKQSKKRNQSIEEIKAIVDRKLAQRDAERDEKRDAERDAARDAARDATRDAARDAEIEVESENVEREASNEGGLQKRRKQSSSESTTVVYGDKEKLKDIKEPKSCFLFSPYTEDTTPIARGMVYPIGDVTIHGGPLIPYYMKVSMDFFVLAFGDTKLLVVSKADDTINLLEQSVGSFFQRPHCRISRTLENTPTSKDKASQSKAVTLQPTLATPIPVAEETTLLMSALQTPVLLETEQAEASLPLEDVPSGMIVAHEDTFHVRVSTEDIMKLWNLDGLNSIILLSFEWGLCKMLQSRNDNRCG